MKTVELSAEDLTSIAKLITEIEKRENEHISDKDISIFVRHEIVFRDSCEPICVYDCDRKVVEFYVKEQK